MNEQINLNTIFDLERKRERERTNAQNGHISKRENNENNIPPLAHRIMRIYTLNEHTRQQRMFAILVVLSQKCHYEHRECDTVQCEHTRT